MMNCPNCAHANPDGAVNCEACFTPLPIIKYIQCPSCNATVLSDAKFCGHCGLNLSGTSVVNSHQDIKVEEAIAPLTATSNESPPILPIPIAMSNSLPEEPTEDDSSASLVVSSAAEVTPTPSFAEIEALLEVETNNPSVTTSAHEPISETSPIASPKTASPKTASPKTQLQQFAASLLHLQTNLIIEIPAHLPVVHIGKPNTVIPPDIDVSGFPDSDIVSRIHADIRADGGSFYFEDTGSSNGTYINNLPLPAGNRHKLRAGDRISLGKGDKVSFVFQLSS